MTRLPRTRTLVLVTTAAFALAAPGAFAERLGGAYRGPEDVQTTKDTGQTTGGTDSSGQPEGGKSDGSGGGDSGGGLGSGDSGGSGGGSGDGGGSGGGSGDGGSTPAPGGGGDSLGGGGDSSGTTARSSGTGPSKGGGGGGGGTSARGKGGADSVQEQLMVVSWYFEHNRERLVSEVADARNRRVTPKKGSLAYYISALPRDTRERSDVTVGDRDKIFDLVRAGATANEDVVRDAAVIALGKIGSPDAVQVLITRLDRESKSDIKEDVVLALGISRSPEAIDALRGVLESPTRHLHPYALLALGLTQDAERAGPILFERFQQDLKRVKQAETEVCAAAMALGNLGYGKAESALVGALKSRSVPDFAKSYIAHALGRLGTDDARKALESLAGADGEDLARSAILALANFSDASVAKMLAGKEGLGRADQLGAGFAALSLGKVLSTLPESDWKKLPDEIREIAMAPGKGPVKAQYANLALSFFDGGFDNEVRKRYAEEMKNGSKLSSDVISSMAMACGVGTLTGFESSLRDIAEGSGFDPKLRGYAALSLAMTGEPSSTAAALRRIYQGADNNPDVQRGAVLGLGLVGDRKDVPFLLDVIVRTDKSRPFANFTRGSAVMAIGLIRDGESVGRIQDLLRNPDPLVRAYAIAALGYMADKDPSPVMPRIFEHANFRQEFRELKVAMRTL